jgi:hypothetical protein
VAGPSGNVSPRYGCILHSGYCPVDSTVPDLVTRKIAHTGAQSASICNTDEKKDRSGIVIRMLVSTILQAMNLVFSGSIKLNELITEVAVNQTLILLTGLF